MQLTEILSELISFKSISPKDGGSLKFLSDLLKKQNFTCTNLNFGNKKNNTFTTNQFAFLKNGNGPHICFAGHVDVVPPGSLNSWSSNPFKAVIKNGKIYGRGACDMKGAIAAYIVAIYNFLDVKKNFKGTISLMTTSDEEGNAEFGTKKIVEWLKKNKIKIDFCIVGEPTNPKLVGEVAKIGRRGSVNCLLTVKGKQGHVAYPKNAINPISDLIKYLNKLQEPLDRGNANFQPSNLEVTSIDTGNVVDNLIPEKISAKFNIRFNTNFTSQCIKKIIRDRLNTVGKNYTIKFNVSGEPFIKESKKYKSFLKKSVQEVAGIGLKMDTSGGTSDARFISKLCPVIEFGSVGRTMHQINENVRIKDLEILSDIYLKFLEKFFSN
ncbi:MAG: succinyl-diaminopimelate desuccinylase [Rickettsiales bacterium]|nr:succinyl-diaminopimelate desuccinylase [Rickettsiales bacterium]